MPSFFTGPDNVCDSSNNDSSEPGESFTDSNVMDKPGTSKDACHLDFFLLHFE